MKGQIMAAFAASMLFTTLMAYSADEAEFTGFLSGYERLEVVPGEALSYMYLAPAAFERGSVYAGLMIDQPEIFVSEDSKYKGVKPADITLIAETLRQALISELDGLFEIVDEPGENVLMLRIALGNLDLKKTKRKLWAYHPVGAAASAGANRKKSVMDKTDLRGAVIEMEFLDSHTGEVMGQLIDVRAKTASDVEAIKKEMNWELVERIFHAYGQRGACRIKNYRLPEEERKPCPAKTLEELIAEMEEED